MGWYKLGARQASGMAGLRYRMSADEHSVMPQEYHEAFCGISKNVRRLGMKRRTCIVY